MMRIENASEPIRALGNQVFDMIVRLTGTRPYLRSDQKCYKAESNGMAFLWVHFYGETAGPNRRNAVVLNTRHAADGNPGVGAAEGNEFHGMDSAELAIRPDEPDTLSRAEVFIREAIAARPSW